MSAAPASRSAPSRTRYQARNEAHAERAAVGLRGEERCLSWACAARGFEAEQFAAFVVDLEGRVLDAEALVQEAFEGAADLVAVVAGRRGTCAEREGKPLVTSQTCRSWTSRTWASPAMA